MKFANLYSVVELIYSIYQYLYEEFCKKINNKQEENIDNSPSHQPNKENEDDVVYNEIYRNSVKLDDFENNNTIDRESLKRISVIIPKNNNDVIDTNIDKKISFSNIYDEKNKDNKDNDEKNKEENIFWNNYYQSET